MTWPVIAGGGAMALCDDFFRSGGELHGRRDSCRLRAGMSESNWSRLIVERALPETLERAMLGKQKFKRVNHARFATSVRRKDRKAWLLAEIERLGLEIGPETLKGQ
jgi:hypothetical protein